MNIQTRVFEDAPAIRERVPLLIGIVSPSGGGKTYSALRLAKGIQSVFGGDIFGIDTENNRMKHYADKFQFRHVPFRPPFGSLDYLAAVRHCANKGAHVTIIDSMTHEHVGEGGYLETAESVVNRIAGDDPKKREAVKMLGWAQAGPLRTKMIEGLKQLDGAFIFCFRAKEKTKPVRRNGKTEVLDLGFMPIGGEEWVYEMTVNCMLGPRSDGIPTWQSEHVGERMMMKLPDQFRGIFAEARPLDEEIGRQLALWANGGAVQKFEDKILEAGRAKAKNGMDALREWWGTIPDADRTRLKATLDNELKATATIADNARERQFSDFDATPQSTAVQTHSPAAEGEADSPPDSSASPNSSSQHSAPRQDAAADHAAPDNSSARPGTASATSGAAEVEWPDGRAPVNERDYAAYCRLGWFLDVHETITPDAAQERWKTERALRNKCHVGEEVRDPLKVELDAIIAAKKAA